jgi:hypothetical protein
MAHLHSPCKRQEISGPEKPHTDTLAAWAGMPV